MTKIDLIKVMMDRALEDMHYRLARWYYLGISYEQKI